MCGIIGCIGKNDVLPCLLDGLTRLEYRGYDSAGLALFAGDRIVVEKAVGPLENLKKKIAGEGKISGQVGIAHTRWATHGKATIENAHPHLSEDGSVCLVHNGIIENASELRSSLLKRSVSFYGETDSEILANLIAIKRKDGDLKPLEAIHAALLEAKGSYALGILFADDPRTIYAMRKENPLVAAKGSDGSLYIASDVAALPSKATEIYFLENGEYAILSMKDGLRFFDSSLCPIAKTPQKACQVEQDDGKGAYPDFMIKEINEQPLVFERSMELLRAGPSSFGLSEDDLRDVESICIVGCGSAHHVALSASYAFGSLAKTPCIPEVASEFRYRNPFLSPHSLFIAVSQSGETADTLAALRLAKKMGVMTLGIVNAADSAIARECDYLYLTPAGREVAVATTKAYSAQLLALRALAVFLAKAKGLLSEEEAKKELSYFDDLPRKTRLLLSKDKEIGDFAMKLRDARALFYIGRLDDYASALEGSLKLKEISYIHSEAYPAGELKHGTLALIEKGVPVVAIVSDEQIKGKTIGNLLEAKARGASTYAISPFGKEEFGEGLGGYLPLPVCHESLYPFLSAIATQLIAYKVAKSKGYDPDKPRNLAKSVTVE